MNCKECRFCQQNKNSKIYTCQREEAAISDPENFVCDNYEVGVSLTKLSITKEEYVKYVDDIMYVKGIIDEIEDTKIIADMLSSSDDVTLVSELGDVKLPNNVRKFFANLMKTYIKQRKTEIDGLFS